MITRTNTMHTSGGSTSGMWQGVSTFVRMIAVQLSSAADVLKDAYFAGLDTILKGLADQPQLPKLVPITIDDKGNRPDNRLSSRQQRSTNC